MSQILDTYSFSDVFVTIAPKGYAARTISGEGLGEISVEYEASNTMMDRAADGSIMTSKINADNGTIHLNIMQTSSHNKYFKALYNYLKAGPTEIWAGATITISKTSGLDLILANGVAFDKRANTPFQAQGQQISWNFMAGNIQYL